jgi:hypothetical protein
LGERSRELFIGVRYRRGSRRVNCSLGKIYTLCFALGLGLMQIVHGGARMYKGWMHASIERECVCAWAKFEVLAAEAA